MYEVYGRMLGEKMSPTNRRLTEELSQIYLQGVQGAIPAAALQFEVIRKKGKCRFPRATVIHHQPHYRKRQLYAEIFGILKPPGLFLNLDHVASPTPRIEALFDSFFVDRLHEFQLQSNPEVTRAQIEQSYFNRPDKKENILANVNEQCEWLRQIGFQEVDCFLKVFELALLGGMKAATPTPSTPGALRPNVL